MIGASINNYRIVSILGKGGMGTVYLAEHPFIGRKAAIKVLRSEFAEDANVVERFMNEARAANAIRHPHIIDIIDVGRLPSGLPYLMMEYLDGESLAQRLATAHRMEISDAVHIVAQVAGALAAAHTKGIVHRDLKPDNLFLTADESAPGRERLKVLDFGIAKLRGELSGSAAKTQTGSLMGTPPYMSPEQCRGLPEDIDHRTDIYALGIILYEMLCGAPPFVSSGWGELVLMHVTQPPRPPRDLRPDLPEAIESVVLKALAKNPADRFQSMGDLQTALRAGQNPGYGSALPDWPPPKGRPDVRAGILDHDAVAAPATSTTFKAASGQIEAGYDTAAIGERNWGRRIALLVGLAAAGAIALAMIGSGSRPPGIDAPSVPGSAATPAAPLPQGAGVAIAPPGSSARPIAPPTPVVAVLRLRSTPTGATVTDQESGKTWGVTPIERQISRSAGVLDLYMEKVGFTPKRLAIPLDRDFETDVSLEPQPGPSSRINMVAGKGAAKGAAKGTAKGARLVPPDRAARLLNPRPLPETPITSIKPAATTVPQPKAATEKW